MKQKEIVLEQLRAMGFELIEVEDMGYIFKYEGVNFLYMTDDEDDKFLRIAIPHLFEVTQENRTAVLEAIHETSLILKYVKLFVMCDTAVWAVYEHYLLSADNLPQLLEHILRGLETAVEVFYKQINGESPYEYFSSSGEISDAEIEEELQKALDNFDNE